MEPTARLSQKRREQQVQGKKVRND
jgi:hypothetical protein